jgi:hypothetical protein
MAKNDDYGHYQQSKNEQKFGYLDPNKKPNHQ